MNKYKCKAVLTDDSISEFIQEFGNVDSARLLLRHDKRIKTLLSVTRIIPRYALFAAVDQMGDTFSQRVDNREWTSLRKAMKETREYRAARPSAELLEI